MASGMCHLIVKSICEETLVTVLSSWKVLALETLSSAEAPTSIPKGIVKKSERAGDDRKKEEGRGGSLCHFMVVTRMDTQKSGLDQRFQ